MESKNHSKLVVRKSKNTFPHRPMGIFMLPTSAETGSIAPPRRRYDEAAAGFWGPIPPPPLAMCGPDMVLKTQSRLDCRQAVAPIKCGHALQPRRQGVRIVLRPFSCCRLGVSPIIKDRSHDLVFHLEGEDEIFQEGPDIGALFGIACPHIGMYGRPAIIGPEHVIAA